MSYFLAFAGFAALIILHEFGHFAAAKAVGMRVERFSLFFPPLVWKVRRGETEYGIGAIPLGGYVKITGMSPHEELPQEVAYRAYLPPAGLEARSSSSPPGPSMNVLIAFLISSGIFLFAGTASRRTSRLAREERGRRPGVLQPGDRLVRSTAERATPGLREQIGTHRCAGPEADGCRAATPATVIVRATAARDGPRSRPRYDAPQLKRPRARLRASRRDERSSGPLEASAEPSTGCGA